MARQRTISGASHPAGCLAGGLNLLEIMVAMLLLAVIVTSSVSLLFINIRGWNALVSDSEKVLDETLINERIVAALRHLSPLVWQSGGKRRLAFNGEPNRVHFISRAPRQFRAGGLFEYLLTQELDSENRTGLVLYYAPYRPDRSEFRLPDAGERRLLFADIGGVTFSYHGKKNRNGKSEWWERWEDQVADYPQLVQMQFAGTGEQSSGASWFIRLLTIDPVPAR
jgi:hypothetical protein